MPDRSAPVRLTGWGRNLAGRSPILPADPDGADLARRVRIAPPDGLLARGLGRAYGDAALNSKGAVVERIGPHRPPAIDESAHTVRVAAGVGFGDLITALLARGWMLPVVPGTRHVTVGGALAADIHGKNHHRDSSIGAWVESLQLIDGRGHCREVRPDHQPELFWATVGGMGCTGVILSATLRIVPVASSWVSVRRTRHRTLSDLFAALTTDAPPRYQVAWVDGVHGAGDVRRSVLEEGEPASREQLPSRVEDPLALRWPRALPAPALPINPLRSPVPQLLNTAWWRRAAGVAEEVVPLDQFFFPLDRLAGWNRIYGPRGLVQYQFVVPWAAGHLVADALNLLNRSGHPPTLVVVKAMGAGTPAPLSFPIPGVTAAIDVADTGTRLRGVLAGLDESVAEAGGRIYLAKDSTSRPAVVQGMYPRITSWREQVADADPHGVFRSDLVRRLELR